MERNQRPVTAEVLIRLAKAYTIELSTLTEDKDPSLLDRLKATMKDPIVADIEISTVEIADVLSNFPGFTDAMLRLYTAYKSEQFALADQQQLAGSSAKADSQTDPVAAVRVFLAANRNCFPRLDSDAEKLSLDGRRMKVQAPAACLQFDNSEVYGFYSSDRSASSIQFSH
ncbi:hypothetical protein [Mesorhizobium captivum]|uniref:hypothetical protein n=1 Tax=Mesorhizobium captivum TaxID=3072319 RepID=UPI002A23DE24|nr:hypothetical protein [Mesorhizobium sp. VK3C]MDX8449168.1 hypothetical protein [Mesorhizobium sp. VK3C]